MEEFGGSPQAPPSYKSYHGGRNLELVDPATLRPIKKVYVVRGSARSRSTSYDQLSYKQFSSKPKKASSSSSSLKGWWNDPEVKRKRRVAKYKLYSTEGKVKASIRRGFRWVKIQCSKIIHGV